jgi:predicted dehydrogenase
MAMRRRTFLRAAGYAGGGLLSERFARGLPSGLRVGVVSEPGGAHLDLFVRPLATAEGLESVALCDPSGQSFERSRKSLAERGAGARTFADHKEMLREFKPDFMIVTVEPVHAPPIVEAGLQAGAHVLSEKPPSVRLADFERVAELARTKQRHLMLALSTRASPAARKARELVEQGYLGKLYGVTMTWIADQTRLKRPEYHKSWTAQKARAGGGKLAFHGVHYLDLIHYIAGSPVTGISGFVRNVGGQPIDVEDAAVVALQFGNGMVGTLNTGYYLDKGYDNMITLWGADGWLRFGYTSKALPLEWYSTRAGAPKGIQTFTYSDTPDDYHVFTQEAVRAARGQGKPPITTAEGLAAMRTVFAGYRAAETGMTQKIG